MLDVKKSVELEDAKSQIPTIGPQPSGTPKREYEPTGHLETALRIAQSAQSNQTQQNLAAGDPAAFKR